MKHSWLPSLMIPLVLTLVTPARAVSSAELLVNQANVYGRFEARIRFAAGDGVVSSFFLWKSGSEVTGAYWNELDFEKLNADCHMQTNALYGTPVVGHIQVNNGPGNLCTEYHTYGFEWAPTYIAWQIDGTEVRRDTGATATAFAQNATDGMQIHFNIWPGNASFGGNFNPAILPVSQYISWVQYSSYSNGEFALQWREDFNGATVPSGWATGDWASPKNLSTDVPANVNFLDGISILSLTADNATGFTGMPPADTGAGGASGAGATGTGAAEGGVGGTTTAGAAGMTAGSGGVSAGAGETSVGSAGSDAESSPPASSGSCGCRLPMRRSPGSPALLALGLAALFACRRRRASHSAARTR